LGRHLSAAEENNLRIETVFLEQTASLPPKCESDYRRSPDSRF
jgi:hypothetical protein